MKEQQVSLLQLMQCLVDRLPKEWEQRAGDSR